MDPLLEKINYLTEDEMNEYAQNLMVGGGTPGPCIVKGSGIRLTDDKGRTYIDCTSQSWAMYLGFGNSEISRVVYEHMQNLSHVHQAFHTKQRYYLAHKLASLAPKNLNRVSFTVGGGAAIEAAMKIALKNVPDARNFICLWDSYHGSTLTAAGGSWIATRSSGKFTGMLDFLPDVNNNFVRAPNPYCYRCYFGHEPETCDLMCAEMLRLTIEKGINGPLAGVILEPIQASGGQIPCPKRYLQRVREICDQYGALLIYDEIQTYCRIGQFFAATYYDVEPDIIVLGKGLGAGLPIAAIIIHDRLKGFSMRAEELHTFANSSVAQVAASKQIEIIERDNLLANTREIGGYLGQKLSDLQEEFAQIGDVRQVGLHIGVEMIEDPVSKKEMSEEKAMQVRSAAMQRGLILGTGGYRKHLLKFKPPLITTRDDADEIINIFREALLAVL
jgi:4-aminobutyrate aminotransferase-like enzyme